MIPTGINVKGLSWLLMGSQESQCWSQAENEEQAGALGVDACLYPLGCYLELAWAGE